MPVPKDQAPDEKIVSKYGNDPEVELTHPAFAQILASRVQGRRTLYGSDFVHQNYITIRLAKSKLQRHLSRDWHFAQGEFVEVCLSEAQWATFVSSLNVGQGVPCTLRYKEGEGMLPGIIWKDKQEDKFRNEVADKIKMAVSEVEATLQAVLDEALPKKKKDGIVSMLQKAVQHLTSNIPFVSEQFDRHIEDKVEKAKLEVNAYATQMLMRLGYDASKTQNMLEASSPILIEDNRNEK